MWIAGYGQNRRADGRTRSAVRRAVVFNDGKKKIALAAVDVVGIQYPTTQEIRKRLTASTTCWSRARIITKGPTCWACGGRALSRAVSIRRTCSASSIAWSRRFKRPTPRRCPRPATYGTADDPTLLRDSREPHVPDGVIRTVTILGIDGKPAGLIVDWSCHPEALGSDNKLITADFPWQTVKRLEEKYKCPVVYFSGAVGGLMTTPSNRYRDSRNIADSTFEYAEAYGNEVADLAIKAIDSAQPLSLAPLAFAAKPISVPLENPLYRVAQMAGVIKRDGHAWSGDFEVIGGPIKGAEGEIAAGVSEVAYLRLANCTSPACRAKCIPSWSTANARSRPIRTPTSPTRRWKSR